MTCLFVGGSTTTSLRHATLLRLASRSELPQLEQRAKEALEMKAMDGSAVHCFKSQMAIPRLFRNKGVVG